MGVLIAVEGIDGAGKRTLSARLVDAWRRSGFSVATAAFPRYGESVHADLGAEALRGAHGDLVDSVYAMALMWALDRREFGESLRALLDGHDVVLLDRYTASNAAYGAARLGEGADGPFAQWVRDLEFGRFALPVPDGQLLLAVPVQVARERAGQREIEEAGRERDAYERDAELQSRVADVYAELASAGWGAPWEVTRPDSDGIDVDALAARFAERVGGPG